MCFYEGRKFTIKNLYLFPFGQVLSADFRGASFPPTLFYIVFSGNKKAFRLA